MIKKILKQGNHSEVDHNKRTSVIIFTVKHWVKSIRPIYGYIKWTTACHLNILHNLTQKQCCVGLNRHKKEQNIEMKTEEQIAHHLTYSNTSDRKCLKCLQSTLTSASSENQCTRLTRIQPEWWNVEVLHYQQIHFVTQVKALISPVMKGLDCSHAFTAGMNHEHLKTEIVDIS